MITEGSKAFGYHFSETKNGITENSLRVKMTEEIELNGENVVLETIGELQMDGNWNGNVCYKIGEDDKYWVGRNPKLAEQGAIGAQESIQGLFTENGDLVEIAIFEGFKDTGTWIKYTKEGYIAFYDHLIPDARIKVLTNFNLLLKDFKKLMGEYKNYKDCETMVFKIIDRIDKRDANEDEMQDQRHIYLNYRDGVREYLGECKIFEESDGFSIEVTGQGLLDYQNQGFIYSKDFDKGLPGGFCYERARSNIAIGHYSEGYLAGLGILVEDDFIKIGHFEENGLKKGMMVLRGDALTIKSEGFVDDMPNGQSIVKYGPDNVYDGEMRNGERHGQGLIIKDESQLLIKGIFEGDKLISEPTVFFANGVEARLLQGGEISDENWKNKLEKFEGDLNFNNFNRMVIKSEDSLYEGEARNFKPNGEGVFSDPGQYSLKGTFLEGEPVGSCTLTSKNCTITLNIDSESTASSNSTAVFSLPFYFLGFQNGASLDNYLDLKDNYIMLTLQSGDFDAIKNASNMDLVSKETLQEMAKQIFGENINFGDLENYGLFYQGDMVKGGSSGHWIMEGHGKMLDALGNYYEGEFMGNKFEGAGVLKKATGEVLKGEFKDGQLLELISGGGGQGNVANGDNLDKFSIAQKPVFNKPGSFALPLIPPLVYKEMIRDIIGANGSFKIDFNPKKLIGFKSLFKAIKKFRR